MKFDEIVNRLLNEATAHPGWDPDVAKAASRPAPRPSSGEETSVVPGHTSKVTDIFNPKTTKLTPIYQVKITKRDGSSMLYKPKGSPYPFQTKDSMEARSKANKLNAMFADKGYAWEAEAFQL